MELVGVLKKTQSSFEEAHHWNIQAKFYSVKVPHIAICMMIISMEYKGQKTKYQYGSLKRNSSMPPSLFLFFFFSFSLFFYFYFFGGLNGSFYLTLICPLWALLIFFLFGMFSSLQGQYSIFYKNIEDLSHFTKVLTKRKCNYHDANVCLCQGSRICNDTSVGNMPQRQ